CFVKQVLELRSNEVLRSAASISKPNVRIIGGTLATALEIEGKLVAHCSTYRLRNNRACDLRGPAAADGDCEPRTAFLSVKGANGRSASLIMNAVEAMSSVDNRQRLLLVKSTHHGASDVLIMVQDSGPGIDPNDMDRIFDAFFTTKPHGMGLGLSICRSIIDSHGGRLWASRRIPHGTVFYVQLPIGESASQ